MMKEKYTQPEVNVIYFNIADIITTSNGREDELPDQEPED